MSSTQVILLERVEKLGNMGDVVNVKPGFARNYLLPQKKALRASQDNIAFFEAQKKHIQAESDKKKKEAEKLLPKLQDVKVSLIRQASESGQLYGSVTARDISAQIETTTGEKIERSKVLVNQNYKQIGLFPVEILLHPEVKAEVIINIARSEEEAETQAKTGKALIASDETEEQETTEVVADETALEEVLEEGALEAEKEKQAAAEAEEQAKAEETARKAEEKAAKEAEEAAKAEAEAAAEESTETSEDSAEEEKTEE